MEHFPPLHSITKLKDEEQKVFSCRVCFAMAVYDYLNNEFSYYDKNEVTSVVPGPSFTTIGAGTMEIMLCRSIIGPATGVFFKIKGTNKMVVVMYSPPCKGVFAYSNFLGQVLKTSEDIC